MTSGQILLVLGGQADLEWFPVLLREEVSGKRVRAARCPLYQIVNMQVRRSISAGTRFGLVISHPFAARI